MGKIGKLIKRFFRGKKEEEKSSPSHDSAVYGEKNSRTLLISVLETILKEKRRWIFGRSSADSKEAAATVQLLPMQATLDSENDQKKHTIVMLLTSGTTRRSVYEIEEAAAIRIQSVFRAHLARKALRALKGLVKLQALVKGYLVRKQATAMLRCMQALVAVQARACEQRIRLREEQKRCSQNQSVCIKLTNEKGFIHTNYDMKEKMKIVETDEESVKSSHCQLCHLHQLRTERINDKLSSSVQYSELDPCQLSPALSELSFRTYCNPFENYSISPQGYNAASKPHPSWGPLIFPHDEYAYSTAYDLPLNPSYMGYTESSRAKVRTQSAPKERLHSFERLRSWRKASKERLHSLERPSSWRNASPERRNVPRRP